MVHTQREAIRSAWMDERVKDPMNRMRLGKQAQRDAKYETIERRLKMIHISKRAVEKLKGTHPSSQKNFFRVFISGIG
jgi:hypothetical protein